ncbi:hypothetical protein MNBD_GAMMA12-2077 [hydrothermal vent metagenome]|uniref:Uncharacterized protein n=1 Tax=hydrothermal vent metagenome TaxID=652676 RepID=A0A3B0ZL68_9ZZZZ
MIEAVESLLYAVFHGWGFILGLAAAALTAWLVSITFFESYNFGIFGILAIPFVALGLYVQYQLELKN